MWFLLTHVSIFIKIHSGHFISRLLKSNKTLYLHLYFRKCCLQATHLYLSSPDHCTHTVWCNVCMYVVFMCLNVMFVLMCVNVYVTVFMFFGCMCFCTYVCLQLCIDMCTQCNVISCQPTTIQCNIE